MGWGERGFSGKGATSFDHGGGDLFAVGLGARFFEFGGIMNSTEFVVNQIDLVGAILSELDRQAKAQGLATLQAHSRVMNEVIKSANAIIDSIERPIVMATDGMGLRAWLVCDDTGLSSMAMAHHLCGVGERNSNHPLDASDFGRCHRFLQAVPEARAKLSEMWEVSRAWASLIDHWDELTALYLEEVLTGSAPKLHARMREIIG